ncbi:MAG TPA: hypothetical protein VFI47_08400 [Acidimicrobiales bacterium]|nr:hypothetical protein [Acidimicrobiales bacterium]
MVTADSEATVAFAERLAGAAAIMGATWVNTVFAPKLTLDVDALRRPPLYAR